MRPRQPRPHSADKALHKSLITNGKDEIRYPRSTAGPLVVNFDSPSRARTPSGHVALPARKAAAEEVAPSVGHNLDKLAGLAKILHRLA